MCVRNQRNKYNHSNSQEIYFFSKRRFRNSIQKNMSARHFKYPVLSYEHIVYELNKEIWWKIVIETFIKLFIFIVHNTIHEINCTCLDHAIVLSRL